VTPLEVVEIQTNPDLKTFAGLQSAELAQIFGILRGYEDSEKGWKRRRGYGLERLVHEALRREGIDSRPSTPQSDGDQIDGAIFFDGRFAVLECKWRKQPTSSTTLTEFQSKVFRRLVGTVGIFISISGYADKSDQYLARSQELNTILVDADDLEWALGATGSMKALLRMKLEHAAWDGVVYWRDPAIQAALTLARQGGGLIVVTQGPKDESLLTRFVDVVGQVAGRQLGIPVIAGYGVYQTNALANALLKQAPAGTRILAVVDADDLSSQEIEQIWKDQSPGVQVIVADPSIESWFSSINTFGEPGVSLLFETLLSASPKGAVDPKWLSEVRDVVLSHRI
jgi:hypothetical protein